MKRTVFVSRPRAVDPLVGQILSDRYRVAARIGEGGIGRVYVAEHLETGREVALKVLLPEYAGNDQLVEAFLNEARTVSRLGHENIIDIYYGARTNAKVAFLAMERLVGCDLADLLKMGPLPWGRARHLFQQVAQALAAVHAHGFVHGDIKPANIFVVNDVGRTDFVKVLDFGIAKAARLEPRRTDDERFAILGTPQYMAPEQTIGAEVDGRADIYSLGCVMYRALVGQVPFNSDSAIDLMAKHSYERPVPLRQRRPDLDIPPAVEAIVLRAMEKKPADRFASMSEMAEAIMRARLTSPPVPARTPSAQFRMDDAQVVRRSHLRRRMMVAGVVAAALFAAASVWSVMRALEPGALKITTTPADAEVRVDDVLMSSGTPASFSVPRGVRLVTVTRPGYASETRTVEVRPRQTSTMQVSLQPSETTGVTITGDPAGAEVWLDGKRLTSGLTGDHTVTRLRPGRHVVELRWRHGVWRSEVEVPPDRIARVHGVLPLPKPAPPKKKRVALRPAATR